MGELKKHKNLVTKIKLLCQNNTKKQQIKIKMVLPSFFCRGHLKRDYKTSKERFASLSLDLHSFILFYGNGVQLVVQTCKNSSDYF